MKHIERGMFHHHNQGSYMDTSETTQVKDHELRNALVEALDENSFLKERIVELEALTVEATSYLDTLQEQF